MDVELLSRQLRRPYFISAGRESGDKSITVPKLNIVAINELFGGGYGGGIVWVIAEKFGPNKTMTVDTDDIGAIVRHVAAPSDHRRQRRTL
jgi:hypothetical protein